MSTVIDPERLRRELAIRGMDAIDLARESSLSPTTVSAALAGSAIAVTDIEAIGQPLYIDVVHLDFFGRYLEEHVQYRSESAPVPGVGWLLSRPHRDHADRPQQSVLRPQCVLQG